MSGLQGLLKGTYTHRLSWMLLILFMPLLVSSTLVKAEDQQHSVQDLRYGVALYHFFQQSYFDALTELMVGELEGDFPNHGENAELLRGGISLSYGLVNEAESIFNRLLERDSGERELAGDQKEQRAQQRNLAWFYLAKLQYQMGEGSKARQALERIEMLPNGDLVDEQEYMSASLFLREGQMDKAEQAIHNLNPASEWLPYYHFNRGVALTEQGDWQQGVLSFQRLEQLDSDTEESKHLRDRAYTASGYAYLAAQQYQLAQQEFSRVRLDSLLVGQALLGYGWAAAQQEDYHQALSPWQSLREQSLMQASTQESLLAVPFAYEKLDAPGNALVEYEQSARLLEGAIDGVDTAIDLFTEAPIEVLFDWEQLAEAPVQDWFANEDLLPVSEYAPYLAYLITRQHFQDRVRQMRELVQLRAFLERGEQRLALNRTVLDERRLIWQARVEGSRERELEERYLRLQDSQKRLQAQLQEAGREDDGMLLMEEEESALWEKIQHGVSIADRLADAGKDMTEEHAKLGLFRGLLLWQANENYSARIWQARRNNTEVDRLLTLTAPALESLQQIALAPDDFGFGQRLSELEARLQGQQDLVQHQIAAAEQSIRHLAVTELKIQRQRLNNYRGQARLAIARLYDQGSRELENDPGSPSVGGQ